MLKKIMDCIPEEDMTLSVNGSVICASEDVKNILVKRYGLRTYVGAELFTDNPKELFLSDWQLYCRKNSKSIDSIWESLNADYSPIENYDRTEVTNTLNNENNTKESSKGSIWLSIAVTFIWMCIQCRRSTDPGS